MNTNLVVVRRDDGIKKLVDVLLANGLSGVPVVDSKERVIGIVTEADVINKEMKARMFSAKNLVKLLNIWKEREKENSVGDIMSEDVFTVSEDTDLFDLIEVVIEMKINRIPVVDTDGRLVGIITRGDLLRGLRSIEG
ncbi:CBS domain-containing protein [Peptoclostridium acidaminophilum]|nr:CBS domain-containing protein [Peptoclostridium acidaminophilum]